MNFQDTLGISTRRSTQYTLRNCFPSTSARKGSSVIASTSHLPSQKSTSHFLKKQVKRPSAADPFAALLKEKKLAGKRGNDDDAFRRAESTVKKITRDRDVLESEIDEDFENDAPELTQDDAIRLISENPLWLTNKLVTPDSTQIRRPGFPVGRDDRQKLFGSGGGGGTVLDILEYDKVVKGQDELSEKVAGIHLWLASDSGMIKDRGSSSYVFPGKTPILNLLNASLKSGGEPKSQCP